MITVALVYPGSTESGTLAEQLRIALAHTDRVEFFHGLAVGEVYERGAPLSAIERAPLRQVGTVDVVRNIDRVSSGAIEELQFSLCNRSGLEVFGGGTEIVHLNMEGAKVAVVEVEASNPIDPLGQEVSEWCLDLLREWVSRCPPLYGRVSVGGSLTWWERNNHSREPRRYFYGRADRLILNPDWAMYLSDSHLDIVGADALRRCGATLEPLDEGAIVVRSPRLLDLAVDIDAWIDCLRPILW